MRGKKFIFTDEQIEYIIQNWGIETAHSMKKKFGCSWDSVVGVAKANGLELPTSNDWTQEEIETLKLLSETYHYEDIAKIMNKTSMAIYLKGRRLGLVLIMDRRKWTKEDEEYLYERWGRDSIEEIAKNMKRTVFSIKVKATRMGLGCMSQANIDQVSVADISDILNVRDERITSTWKKLGLKLRKKKVTENYGYYCVDLDKLLEFLKEHQDLWNSQYLEKNILGEEPEWLLQKRKDDLVNPPFEYQVWTKEELELAKQLLLQRHDYNYISSQVNHSPEGVACKLRELGLSYRLAQFWTGSELKLVKENYPNMTAKELSGIIGRTPKAIQYKASQLGIKKKVLKLGTKQDE